MKHLRSYKSLKGLALKPAKGAGHLLRLLLFPHIQTRIVFEKPCRNQLKSRLMHRHYGPFFRARCMGHAERVPEDDVLILQRSILFRPNWKSIGGASLIGISPGSVHFIVALRGRP